MWYNWLLLEELDVDASGAVTGVAKKYTWGLDLAGQMGSAGVSPAIGGAAGIGGLLAVHDPEDDPTPDKNYVYFYDANGNVGQLIDWENDGTLVAKYEYDPYGGNLLDPTDPQESGPYAAENPFRFSTKYFDAETALGYWGYRYYSPRLGRFINRDPIDEIGAAVLRSPSNTGNARRLVPRVPLGSGGPNAYGYALNQPSIQVDPLGLDPTINWFVDIRPSQANPISLDAVIRVTVIDKPRCFCDEILWIQLVNEIKVGPLFSGGTGGWMIDDADIRPHEASPQHHWQPWYQKDVVIGEPYETKNGCVVSSELRDSPRAASPSWWWRAFRQDFETCAICARTKDATCPRGNSCVLGCVQWGHIYHRDTGQVVQPVRYPLAPSSTMLEVLKSYNKRVRRGPTDHRGVTDEVETRLGGPWTEIDASCGT